MKEYNFSDIIDVSKRTIQFNDGYLLDLEKCRKEWAVKNNIPLSETVCIGFRNIAVDIPYYVFYDNGNKIRVHFCTKGFLKRKRIKKFIEFQMRLNKLGYYTYDES